LIRRAQDKAASAYLKIFKSKSEVENIFGTRAKKQLEVMDKLFERFGEDVLNGFDFNLDDLSAILDISKDSLRRFIKKLEDNGLADYKPPFKGTEIEILKRLDAHEVKFDREALKNKLKHAHTKLDKIENYVFYPGCRASYITEYFGEIGSRCGICDNCQDHGALELDLGGAFASPLEVEGDLALAARGSLLRPSFGGQDGEAMPMSTKLTQLETFDLYNQGLDIEAMAKIRNLKPATIVEHLCFLINANMQIEISRFVSEEIKERICETIARLGKERLAPIKEELGDEISWNHIKLVLAQYK
jgi:ATP-dependent DNA helicase RecQ